MTPLSNRYKAASEQFVCEILSLLLIYLYIFHVVSYHCYHPLKRANILRQFRLKDYGFKVYYADSHRLSHGK